MAHFQSFETARRSPALPHRWVSGAVITLLLVGSAPSTAQISATRPALDTRDLLAGLTSGSYSSGVATSITVTRDGKVYFLRTNGSVVGARQLLEFDPATKVERLVLLPSLIDELLPSITPTPPTSRPGVGTTGGVRGLARVEQLATPPVRALTRPATAPTTPLTPPLVPPGSAAPPTTRPRAGGISGYSLSPDERFMTLSLGGRTAVVRKEPDGTWAATGFRHTGSGTLTPDGKRFVYTRADSLWQKDTQTGTETAISPVATSLSSGATQPPPGTTRPSPGTTPPSPGTAPTLTYGSAEYIAQEEFSRFRGHWLSPDSRFVAYQETDVAPVDKLYVGSPLTPDEMPSLRRYPRAGRPNANVRLFIKNITDDSAPVLVAWDQKAYPYLTYASWGGADVGHGGGSSGGVSPVTTAPTTSIPFSFVVMNRLQTEAVAYAVIDGVVTEIAREKDSAWVNVEPVPRFLSSGKQFLWISEASGEPVLQLRTVGDKPDTATTLTPPGFGLQEIVSVTGDAIFVSAHPNPTQQHLYRLSFDPKIAPVKLTEGVGIHRTSVSPAEAVDTLFVDSFSSLSGPVSVTVRQGGQRFGPDGGSAELGVLKSFATKPAREVQLQLTTAKNDVGDDLQIGLIFAKGFDPARAEKWPVILNVYAGPGVTTVHGNWREFIPEQWLADTVGAVVVSIDGRGSPGRNRKWEREIKGNLADVPMADQVAGLKAILAKHPEFDASRVGVWGWSFGGYMSCMLAMREPDLIKAAVAGAPVSEWRDYDTAYTERYLGLPETTPLPYANSSLFKWSAGLRVPLLVFHGTADDNVLFTASARLAADSLRNRTPLQLIPMPGMGHGMSFGAYVPVYTKVADFFREHLR